MAAEFWRLRFVDDPAEIELAATIEGIQSLIRRNPGISQTELIEKTRLPETKGRAS
jgi:hypothetical protein